MKLSSELSDKASAFAVWVSIIDYLTSFILVEKNLLKSKTLGGGKQKQVTLFHLKKTIWKLIFSLMTLKDKI